MRELDPLVSPRAGRDGPPRPYRDTQDVRTRRRARSRGGAHGQPPSGKNLLFPTADGELVLRVHLMSAGRLRYLPAYKKGPTKPMFQVRFTDGGELLLHEAGKKKRAGVWLVTPEELDAELAHLGPDALEVDRATLGRDPRSERRQLHPLLRDQRALAGIGRAHANEILGGAALPFRLSTDLADEEIETLASAIRDDLSRALELRIAARATPTSPHPRPLRRAVPAVRRGPAARGLRGAHDHLLSRLPDGWARPQGPLPLTAAPLTPRPFLPAGGAALREPSRRSRHRALRPRIPYCALRPGTATDAPEA